MHIHPNARIWRGVHHLSPLVIAEAIATRPELLLPAPPNPHRQLAATVLPEHQPVHPSTVTATKLMPQRPLGHKAPPLVKLPLPPRPAPLDLSALADRFTVRT